MSGRQESINDFGYEEPDDPADGDGKHRYRTTEQMEDLVNHTSERITQGNELLKSQNLTPRSLKVKFHGMSTRRFIAESAEIFQEEMIETIPGSSQLSLPQMRYKIPQLKYINRLTQTTPEVILQQSNVPNNNQTNQDHFFGILFTEATLTLIGHMHEHPDLITKFKDFIAQNQVESNLIKSVFNENIFKLLSEQNENSPEVIDDTEETTVNLESAFNTELNVANPDNYNDNRSELIEDLEETSETSTAINVQDNPETSTNRSDLIQKREENSENTTSTAPPPPPHENVAVQETFDYSTAHRDPIPIPAASAMLKRRDFIVINMPAETTESPLSKKPIFHTICSSLGITMSETGYKLWLEGFKGEITPTINSSTSSASTNWGLGLSSWTSRLTRR